MKSFQPSKGNAELLEKEGAVNLYKESIGLIKNIYDKIRANKKIVEEEKNITNCVERFVNQQCLDNDNILSLLNVHISPKENYIYNHVVNTCIIAIDIGIGLGYDKSKLFELGLTAILHDMGMIKLYNIYNLPRRLSVKEYEEIKKHPLIGAEILEKFISIAKKVISSACQEHERINGSGYPYKLKGNAIDEYAKIIGVADVYEAMTHVRPYRNKLHPYEALNQIIDTKDTFEKRIIKILVRRICCPFPLGSYIKLNTGEKGKVIKRNLKNPTRPTVEIGYSTNGNKLRKPKVTDLAKHPKFYVEDYLKSLKSKKRPD